MRKINRDYNILLSNFDTVKHSKKTMFSFGPIKKIEFGEPSGQGFSIQSLINEIPNFKTGFEKRKEIEKAS